MLSISFCCATWFREGNIKLEIYSGRTLKFRIYASIQITGRPSWGRNATLFRNTFSNKLYVIPSSNTSTFIEVEVMEIQRTSRFVTLYVSLEGVPLPSAWRWVWGAEEYWGKDINWSIKLFLISWKTSHAPKVEATAKAVRE